MNTQRQIRMTLNDTMLASIFKLSEGHPGALVCLGDAVIRNAARIDPDSALGAFGVLMDLDQMGIYGQQIYDLFVVVCGEDPVNLLALLRANQLGQLAGVTEHAIIRAASAPQPHAFDFDAILTAVRARLPRFARGIYVAEATDVPL